MRDSPMRHFWAQKRPDQSLDALFLRDVFRSTVLSQTLYFHREKCHHCGHHHSSAPDVAYRRDKLFRMRYIGSVPVANDLAYHKEMVWTISGLHCNQLLALLFVSSTRPSHFQALLITESRHFALRTLHEFVLWRFATAKTFRNIRNLWI